MAILTAQYNPIDGQIHKIEFAIIGVARHIGQYQTITVSFKVGSQRVECWIAPTKSDGYTVQFSELHLPEPLKRRLMLAAMKEVANQEREEYQEEIAEAMEMANAAPKDEPAPNTLRSIARRHPEQMAPWYFAMYQ